MLFIFGSGSLAESKSINLAWKMSGNINFPADICFTCRDTRMRASPRLTQSNRFLTWSDIFEMYI